MSEPKLSNFGKKYKQVQRLFCGHFGCPRAVLEVSTCSIGGTENPGNASTEVIPRSVLKVTKWVAFECFGLIAPYFFEDDHGAYLHGESEELSRNNTKFLFPKLRVQARRRN